MDSGTPRRDSPPARRQATVLESVEELRAQVRAAAATRTEPERVPPAQGDRERLGEALPYRPLSRPSMGLLHVYDDGEPTGEAVRVRGGSFVIGRVEGDLVIPHDSGMSGRHAEIVRRSDGAGGWTWHLRDLGSTNGTFVRASSILLEHDQEFMLGMRIFRFEALKPAVEEPAARANATRRWNAPIRGGSGDQTLGVEAARLVEVSNGAVVRRHELTEREAWIGRDPSCCKVVVDDPFVDLRHARLACDAKGRWTIANERSRNGLWGRIAEVGLERGGVFQCGEQRFLFRAL